MTHREPLKLWFHMAQNVVDGSWFRVGSPYRSMKLAKDWLSFVKSAWPGHTIRIRSFVVKFGPDGKATSDSLEKLDKVFNLDVSV
jgi:hypothetical protein